MESNYEQFKLQIEKFRKICPVVQNHASSRIESVIPRITVQRQKKTSTVFGLSSLARHTRRPEEYVETFFIKQTACIVEKLEENRLTVRGHLSNKEIKKFESRYLKLKVLCSLCKNPDTLLVDKIIECRNCNKKREDD